ncbi:hypothetical protein L3Q82_005075 [Scortum barcoo]|uniref:Uncharacterized protein n=1 Tax=Scortum barcoo TaxID=214431 RepID=A0ACB8VE26_9TELE|nr:hypothetical protein L3Q82_005075 [Scortum barcoo]
MYRSSRTTQPSWACIRSGQEDEYRELIKDFVTWCDSNHLLLNTTKTREMVVDFRRPRLHPEPVIIKGDCVEVVHTYKYLGVQLDDKLDWTANTDALCRKGQSHLYFLRRLASFNICKKLLQIFYQSVVASALLYAVVCWGGSLKKKDTACRLDKLVRKAGSVVGTELDSLTSVAERRTLNRLLSIIDNPRFPVRSVDMQRATDNITIRQGDTAIIRKALAEAKCVTALSVWLHGKDTGHGGEEEEEEEAERCALLFEDKTNQPELCRFGLRRRLQHYRTALSALTGKCSKEGTDLDGYTSSVLSYLKFCADVVLPTKTIKVFPNQKPWLDSTVMKPLLKACDAAYRSDDTTIVGLISDNDETHYREEIQHLTQWCSNNNLVLNTSKTKEVIVDYRRSRRTEHAPLLIHGEAVERVNNIKFLGIHITSDLTWSMNTAHLVKKAQQRLFFLRKLKRAGLSSSAPDKLLQGHNREHPLPQCNSVVWQLHCTRPKKDLARMVKTAQGIVGSPLPDLDSIYAGRMQKKARHIAADPTHLDNGLFVPLPSGKQ